MRRTMMLLAASLGPVLAVTAGTMASSASGAASTPAPDPGYVPKAGDRAVLYSPGSERIPQDLWCATTKQQWRDFITDLFRDAKPEDQGAAGAAEILHPAPRTEIELLSCESFPIETGNGEPPLTCTCCTIRVLSGPFQGKTLYTPDFQVARLVEPLSVPPASRPATPDGPDCPVSSLPPAPGLSAPEPVVPGAPSGAQREPEQTVPPPDARRTSAVEATASPAVAAPLARDQTRREVDAEVPREAPAVSELPLRAPVAARPKPLETPLPPPPTAPGVADLPAAAPGSSPSNRTVTPPAPRPAAPVAPDLQVAAPVTSRPNPAETPRPPRPAAPAVPPRPAVAETMAPPGAARSVPALLTDRRLPPARPSRTEPAPASPTIAREGPGALVNPVASAATRVTPRARGTVASRGTAVPLGTAGANAVDPPAAAVNPARRPLAARPAPATTRVEAGGEDPNRPSVRAPAPPPPPAAAALIAAARTLEHEQRRLDAMVQYRNVQKAYPTSPEAGVAAERIAALTGALAIEAEDARARQLVSQARGLEAAGEVSRALAHYHQVVKVYPKTPSARLCSERIRALSGNVSSPRR